jgi:hypothetical protein
LWVIESVTGRLQKNSGPVHPRRRLFVALAAAVVLISVTVAALVLPGWRARQVEEEPRALTGPEIAEVKAAVEKQTGMPIRYVGGIRQGVVEAFPEGIAGRPAYRVEKTEEGWKVIAEFHAYFA